MRCAPPMEILGVNDFNTFNLCTSTRIWLSVASALLAYLLGRAVYLFYFHPASKFPGPKLAAVSWLPYCYHRFRGRLPWFQEYLLRTYGDVARVGPNEIVFFTPQAARDIYNYSVPNDKLFVKTSLQDFGTGDLGFIWEYDPVKHRAVGKKVFPAFSSRALKEKGPVIDAYMDLFVERMKDLGSCPEGLLMNDWLLWLSVDMAGDMVYGREMHHLEDGQSSDVIDAIRGASFPSALIQTAKKIPLIALLAPLFVPPRVMRCVSAFYKSNSAAVKARIDKRGNTKHADFMDFMLRPEDPPPTTEKELKHVELVALQLFVSAFDPFQVVFYAAVFLLAKHPEARVALTQEIRGAFTTYDAITPEALSRLPYLTAVIHETLRAQMASASGMPRVSPSTFVDGVYVPRGVVVQLSNFTTMRHERYFADPLGYHPERWLSPDHPRYDTRFARDNLNAFYPFNLGPRQCTGREFAWTLARIFLGKVLWTFNLEAVSGHEKSFDRDFSVHILWNKPALYVRFLPAEGYDS